MDKILLVEDDAFLREGLFEMLKKEGYDVNAAIDCKEAKAQIADCNFSLIILDVMLPDGSGYDLCRAIRKIDTQTPILFLTACDEEKQIVKGLDLGGDDYIVKPFKLLELTSRIRALLRRNGGNIVVLGDIVLNNSNMTVKKGGNTIFATPIEFQILSLLIRSNGNVVSRNSLLRSIWDDNNNFIDDNTLSVHISRLREKIGSGYISTVRGIGYRWEVK